MTIVLWLWLASEGLELAGQLPLVWRARKFLAPVNILLMLAFMIGLLAWRVDVFSFLIAFIALYRIFNQLRIMKGRMHEHYLRRSTLRTALVLLGFQALIGLAWVIWSSWHTTGEATWTAIAIKEVVGAVILLAATARRLRRTAWPANVATFPDSQLPTVSVVIPARNETEDLKACLQSVIASDYPKLEVLVLDDCSQTKETPEIIRSFAHDGVRFIQGEPPRDTWLPKNQAYDRLAQQASGEYLLYCGVDVHFAPDSIRQIMNALLAKKKQMMSILPLRDSRQLALVQAMRYFWELVPPRRLFNRPPVLSSCWIISRVALQKLGGFQSVTRSILPEAYFARRLTATDEYSFMRAGRAPGVTSSKSRSDQQQTAIRTRYPQLHRRPENVLATVVLEAAFLVAPFILAIGGFWLPIGLPAQLLAALASVLLIITFQLMGLSTRITTMSFGFIALPIVVTYDIIMLPISMWQYEFSTVEWKGRNICIPAMHVIPHLPQI